jgi:hypothetical protein
MSRDNLLSILIFFLETHGQKVLFVSNIATPLLRGLVFTKNIRMQCFELANSLLLAGANKPLRILANAKIRRQKLSFCKKKLSREGAGAHHPQPGNCGMAFLPKPMGQQDLVDESRPV